MCGDHNAKDTGKRMRAAIMQPGYLPWLGFFEMMHNCDLFVFLDDVQYTRKDWRSRNRIRTKEGWVFLTVPVLTKNRRFQLIKEAEINNHESWKKKHLHSLAINYRRAPYFDEYFPGLQHIYRKDWIYLADLDIEIIAWLSQKLGITTPTVRSSVLQTTGKREEKIINICKAIGAQVLYDTQAARDILDPEVFRDANIKIEFQDYRHPVYKQIYEPFIPSMSVIDLLFQHGPKSLEILLYDKMAQI